MEWTDFRLLVEAYLEENDLGQIADVITLLIGVAEDEDKEREYAMKSIKDLLKNREGSPFRQGTRSSNPISVKVVIDKVANMVYVASISYFNSVPNGLHLKHGKSGGGAYASAQEYALNEKAKIKTVLQRRYKDKVWDGTLEGLGYEESISYNNTDEINSINK